MIIYINMALNFRYFLIFSSSSRDFPILVLSMYPDIFSSESLKGPRPKLLCETICLLADRHDVRLGVGVGSVVKVSTVSHLPLKVVFLLTRS